MDSGVGRGLAASDRTIAGMRVAFDVGPVRSEPAGVGLYSVAMATSLHDALPAEGLALIGRRPDASGLPAVAHERGRSPRGPYLAWLELASARDARRLGASLVHYSDGVVPFVRHGPSFVAVHDLSIVTQWRSHPKLRYARIGLVLAAPHLAHTVLVPSRATADEVIRLTRCPARKIEIVPYAPQRDVEPADDDAIDRVLATIGLARHEYVLALGTIEPRKNHVRLIGAFERLVRSDPRFGGLKLVIAGRPGWGMGPVTRAIAESPAKANIVELGYVGADDLPGLVTGSGAVAYVSLYEGFGLPVVEAMACGAPTVTSNVSSMPEVGGDAAFLVDPLDVGSIAEGLEDALVAGVSDRAGVARSSKAQAATFTWASSATTCVELYRRALGS